MNERGSAQIGGLLAVFAAVSLLLTAGLLWATGIARQQILPRLQARAASVAPAAGGEAPAAAEAEEPALGAQADSLRALRAQVRLEQEALAARSAELEGRIENWKALQQADDAAHARQIASLARVYSAMKPEAAARVLVRLDEATFEQVVARLEPRAAGKILALIDPERVARLARPARPSPGGAASSGETGETS